MNNVTHVWCLIYGVTNHIWVVIYGFMGPYINIPYMDPVYPEPYMVTRVIIYG